MFDHVSVNLADKARHCSCRREPDLRVRLNRLFVSFGVKTHSACSAEEMDRPIQRAAKKRLSDIRRPSAQVSLTNSSSLGRELADRDREPPVRRRFISDTRMCIWPDLGHDARSLPDEWAEPLSVEE
jgi:hypothetical protein